MSNIVAGSLAGTPVLVLAGGLGTRLRATYQQGPKVMAPIDGRPFLAYVLGGLHQAGFRFVVLCVGYRYQDIQTWLGDGQRVGLDVRYSIEDQPLGTGGAVLQAATRFAPAGRFFVLNGDSLLHLDFQAMQETHVQLNALATIALATVPDVSRYGVVELDDDERVREFCEKSANHSPGYINGGTYLFESEVLNLIPQGRAVSLEHEVLPHLVSRGLRAFKSRGYFVDIGVPEDFLKAQTELAELKWL